MILAFLEVSGTRTVIREHVLIRYLWDFYCFIHNITLFLRDYSHLMRCCVLKYEDYLVFKQIFKPKISPLSNWLVILFKSIFLKDFFGFVRSISNMIEKK